MSTPVNPILVIENNLPEYEAELVNERERLLERVAKIDADLATMKRLYTALRAPEGVI